MSFPTIVLPVALVVSQIPSRCKSVDCQPADGAEVIDSVGVSWVGPVQFDDSVSEGSIVRCRGPSFGQCLSHRGESRAEIDRMRSAVIRIDHDKSISEQVPIRLAADR